MTEDDQGYFPASTVDFEGQQKPAGIGSELIPRNMKMQSVEMDSLDPILREKIYVYEDAKRQAVQIEDFDQAKHVKMIVDKLKVLGN